MRYPWVWIMLLSSFASMSSAGELTLGRNEKFAEQSSAEKIAKRIFEKAGLGLKVVALPPERAKRMSEQGELDGEMARISSYGMSNQSVERLDPPYYWLDTMVFGRRELSSSIDSVESLRGLKIGAVRGVAHSNKLLAGLDGVSLAVDSEAMFKMLESGRVDVVVDSAESGLETLCKMGLDKKGFSGLKNMGRHGLHIYIGKTGSWAKKDLQEALQAAQSSGELARWQKEASGSGSCKGSGK